MRDPKTILDAATRDGAVDQPVGARAQDWSFQFKLVQHPGWRSLLSFLGPALREPRKYATAALQSLEREQPFRAPGLVDLDALHWCGALNRVNITLKEY